MCIAIYKPVGKTIDKKTFEQCFKNNSDGCGFAYVNLEDSSIVIEKSMEFEDFYSKYTTAIESNPESNFIIHFRIRTHGETNLDNCHPFRINDSQAFIHNGIISKAKVDPDKKKSDTQMFNEEYLQNLPYQWEKSAPIIKILNDYLGTSKLCILTSDNSVVIVNESCGHWEDDIWWSNYSHRCLKTYSKYTGKEVITHNSYPINKNTRSKWSGITDKFDNKPAESRSNYLNLAGAGKIGTIPTHKHSNLLFLIEDEFLKETAIEFKDYCECEVCGAQEISYMVTGISMDGVYYRCCRDCLSTLDDAGMIYYEEFAQDIVKLYTHYYPGDNDDIGSNEFPPEDNVHYRSRQTRLLSDVVLVVNTLICCSKRNTMRCKACNKILNRTEEYWRPETTSYNDLCTKCMDEVYSDINLIRLTQEDRRGLTLAANVILKQGSIDDKAK